MEINRKSFQGVSNIIRFNWHFYVLALIAIIFLLLLATQINHVCKPYAYTLCVLVFCSITISLLASYYVYDLSDLYQLNWINKEGSNQVIVNIHSGFDETSIPLKQTFPLASLSVFDFYDPAKHTEISIKRARKSYPSFPGTEGISTDYIPLTDDSADKIVVTLSAHEIREPEERIVFFKELYRIVKPSGNVYVTEHLRDAANLMVYNIGFFHFHSKHTWLKTFKQAGLEVQQEIKTTPFISTFILTKNGHSI